MSLSPSPFVAAPDARRQAALSGLSALATRSFLPTDALNGLVQLAAATPPPVPTPQPPPAPAASVAAGSALAQMPHVAPKAPTLKAAPKVVGAKESSPSDQAAVQLVQQYVGTPYVWGGESPKGFDCSGLLQYVWAKQGVQIPRTTYDQWSAGAPVAKGQLHPGDAVFFKGSDSKTVNGQVLPGHVGIYIGGGKFIEAPHTGANVRISQLAGRDDYMGARRYA